MKKLIRYLLVLLYLGITLIALLILVKPGASIFFIKKNIDPQAVAQDAGESYRYRLEVNPRLVRTQGVQVYENGQLLTLSSSNIVASSGTGSYAISTGPQGETYIYFAASDNSDPVTNGKTYTLYLPLTFISRLMGLVYVILLMPLVVRLMVFAWQKDQRKLITSSPGGSVQVLDSFFERSVRSIPAEIHGLWRKKTEGSHWKRLATTVVLVAYLYILMEWIFFITMPSFMSLTSIFSKVEILLLSGLVLTLFCLVAVAIFVLLDFLTLIAHKNRYAQQLELAIPAMVLSAFVLLLVDNFTYTIFKFGIITSTGIVRGLYGLFFIFCAGYFYIRMLKGFAVRGEARPQKDAPKPLFFLSLGILVISLGLAVSRSDFSSLSASDTNVRPQEASSQPNIVLLGSDGLSADHLSVYGYERDTTPRLNELAQTSLVADNAFPNAAKTTGSIVAMMTSKLPTETRVLFPPNILTGMDAYQHLPGMLRNAGYETVELGAPYYVDSYNYNFQNAYDMVNNRTEDENSISNLGRKLGFDNAVYFLNKIYGRIADRIQHIMFLRQMPDPYAIVTHPVESINDEQKIRETLDLLDHANKPLFIHVHLLGTHGPRYEPPVNVFSKGEKQTENYMADFYDDTILAFDRYTGEVIDHLKANGQFEHTILIIYTDHNYKYEATERIPLIFHFPSDQYAGRLASNVQSLDIAPTVLEYLGMAVPDWMHGKSLLHGELDRHRLVFGANLSGEAFTETNAAQLDLNRLKPPFYQFSFFDIIDCQKWYVLNLVDDIWSSGEVSGYVAPCNQNSLLSFEEIKQAAIDQLTKDGFDTSSIH